MNEIIRDKRLQAKVIMLDEEIKNKFKEECSNRGLVLNKFIHDSYATDNPTELQDIHNEIVTKLLKVKL